MRPPSLHLASASAPPNLFRHASALCPRLQTFCSMRPPSVYLASCLGAPPNLLRHLSAFARGPNLVRHLSAFCPPAPRVQTLSALRFSALSPLWLTLQPRPPCVGQPLRFASALAAPPNVVSPVALCVRHMSGLLLVFSLCSHCPPNLVCHVSALPFVYHASAKAGLASSTLSALGPSAKILSHPCATHSAYMARWPVSFMYSFWLTKFEVTHPTLAKLFGVYAGLIPQTVYCGVLS